MFYKNFKILYMLACFFVLMGVLKNTFAGENQTSIPAVWLWEVSGGKRVIYLAGELHAFDREEAFSVDYQLGLDVYNASSEVWMEVPQPISSTQFKSRKLSEQIGVKRWNRVRDAVADTLRYSKLPSSAKSSLVEEELKIINQESAGMAFFRFILLSYSKYLLEEKKREFVLPGMTLKLEKQEKDNKENKIKYIEKETAIDEAWNQNCNTDDLAGEYIDEGLKFFELNHFWKAKKSQIIQKAFMENDISPSKILSSWLINFPGGQLMLRCNIIPRNMMWMPQILASLESEGPPIVFMVGVAHIAGESGLLSILQKNGYTKIRRIFSIADN